jgi:hypothetical protein
MTLESEKELDLFGKCYDVALYTSLYFDSSKCLRFGNYRKCKDT